MNVEELPMIIFTVLAQMSVGAFWILGAIQLYGRLRGNHAATERVTHAALFAVGPLLVLGFFAAFFHLNDPFNALNTLRHIGSSWLSREILFGVLYGGLGFLYTVCAWFGWLNRPVRQALAVLTALAGLGLVISMCGVYYSVETIPAWHSPATWIFFFASVLLTGSLAVGVALLFAWNRQASYEASRKEGGLNGLYKKIQLISDEPSSHDADKLTTTSLKGISLTAAVAGLVLLVTYPVYLLGLSNNGDAASQHVAEALSESCILPWRLVLLALVVVIAGVFAFVRARGLDAPTKALVVLIVTVFVLAVITELLGRGLHYEGLYHVGLNTTQTGLSYLPTN